MNRAGIQRSIESFGLAKTVQDLAFRALNRIIFIKILKGVTISTPDLKFTQCGQNYRGLFFDAAALRRLSADPEYELPDNFLNEALANGDECYGFVEGDTLAAYGWYSKRPTPIDIPELILHFDPQYIYMYKGFTHVNHRGQRLHAAGMTKALQRYLEQGHKGIVSYIEWNNFASLKSCLRMGYSEFGTIAVTKLFGRYFIHSSSGCKRYGFRLEVRRRASVPKRADRGAAVIHG